MASCKLIAIIPCSDAFGVDAVVDKYEEAIVKRRDSRVSLANPSEMYLKELSKSMKNIDVADNYRRLNDTVESRSSSEADDQQLQMTARSGTQAYRSQRVADSNEGAQQKVF